jgi:ornithine cyclodeaminase/alanine dehydrogenase-like protein (mu-crystallin family)
MTKLLSKNEGMKVLDMKNTNESLEEAFCDLATGNAVMPQRTPIASPDHGGLALFMPAYLKGMGALGAKVVTVYKDNPSRYNMPTVLGTIILLEEKTGATIAIMDGGYLTAMRTGGVAGLASKFLSAKDAKVHTLFGTGGMAKTHAWAVDCVRKIEKLYVYSIDPIEKRVAFRDSLRDVIGCEIILAEDPAQAVGEADIVTIITSSKDPVVDSDWFKPGVHINGIGSHAPSARELDSKTVIRAKVVCDLVDACRAEAGDFIIPAEAGEWSWDKVHGSLGDVITGNIPGRENDAEITLFKSVGLAIQDISTAFHVYTKAIEMGVGSEFKF